MVWVPHLAVGGHHWLPGPLRKGVAAWLLVSLRQLRWRLGVIWGPMLRLGRAPLEGLCLGLLLRMSAPVGGTYRITTLESAVPAVRSLLCDRLWTVLPALFVPLLTPRLRRHTLISRIQHALVACGPAIIVGLSANNSQMVMCLSHSLSLSRRFLPKFT